VPRSVRSVTEDETPVVRVERGAASAAELGAVVALLLARACGALARPTDGAAPKRAHWHRPDRSHPFAVTRSWCAPEGGLRGPR
jgi:hypothetical protein